MSAFSAADQGVIGRRLVTLPRSPSLSFPGRQSRACWGATLSRHARHWAACQGAKGHDQGAKTRFLEETHEQSGNATRR
jgi:hypothetical protein